MNTEEFVHLFYQERKEILDSIFKNEEVKSVAAQSIRKMTLNENDTERLKGALNTLLTDTFYTILLGLDGAASIGQEQHSYKIWDDEEEEFIGGVGDLEVEAYEYFCSYKDELKDSEADYTAFLYFQEDELNKEPLLRNEDIVSIQTSKSDDLYQTKIQLIERDFIFAGESVGAKLFMIDSDNTPESIRIHTNIKIYKNKKLIGAGKILLNKDSLDYLT